MRSLTVFFLALLPLLPAQEASTPVAMATAGGTRILGGGGKLPKAIYERFLELAGGTNARIVLIPTASGSCDTEAGLAAVLKRWTDDHPGYRFEVLHTRDRARADDEAFCAPLRTATAVWLGGGTQKNLADAYLGTRVETELMALLARGGVVGGTSAGTAIQTRTMIQEGKENPIVATGFDFVPGAISDQHFLKRERLPRLLKVLAAHPGHFGIGVDEGTAVEIDGEGAARVLGASKALFVLAAQNGHEQIVQEVAPDPRGVAFGEQVLDEWRKAARQRASWELAAVSSPRLPGGTLVLGVGPAARERFAELAGGRTATLVLLGLQRTDLLAERQKLLAVGATDTTIFELGGAVESAELVTRLGRATGVVLMDSNLHDSDSLAAAVDTDALREAVRSVLARGGVAWGNGIVGEVVARSRYLNAKTTLPFGYRRGLGLLPGATIVHRRLQRTTPGVIEGPITDGAPHEWVYGCAREMPRILGVHVESAAIVRGSTLEVLGDLPTHVLPTRADGKPGDAREKVTLEPGSKWDLATGKKL